MSNPATIRQAVTGKMEGALEHLRRDLGGLRTGRASVALLDNIRVERRLDLAAPELVEALERQRARLAGKGRLLVRPSGTEPLVRVMVEAEDEALLAEVLADAGRAIEQQAARQAG